MSDIKSDGGTLAGSTAAVRIAYSEQYSKYFMIQNNGTDDLWYGFDKATTVVDKAFILAAGEVAAVNVVGSGGAASLYAMASGVNPVKYVVATNGTVV